MPFVDAASRRVALVRQTFFHSLKLFRSKEINNLLGRTGTLWQKESFDHIVRGPTQGERIERYLHDKSVRFACRLVLARLHSYPMNDLQTASGE